jgi:hypothetical protein
MDYIPASMDTRKQNENQTNKIRAGTTPCRWAALKTAASVRPVSQSEHWLFGPLWHCLVRYLLLKGLNAEIKTLVSEAGEDY